LQRLSLVCLAGHSTSPQVSMFMYSHPLRSFLCWSISFYPQPTENYRRRSTHGLTVDFPALNVLGFSAYTVSNAAFLWSPTVREQYAQRHPASPEPTVRFNDFAFAIHAVVLSVITYSQFFHCLWGFNVGLRQRMSRLVACIIIFSVIAVVVGVIKVRFQKENDTQWEWIDVVSFSNKT
jgi:cystinosin